MPYCAVPHCKNRTGKGNVRQNDVSFHRFPKDDSLAQVWWETIKRGGLLSDIKDPRLCSDHFTDGDYQETIESIPGPHPVKTKLVPAAIPSRNIRSNRPPRLVS